MPEAVEILDVLGLGDRVVPAPTGPAPTGPASSGPPLASGRVWGTADLTPAALAGARPTLIFTSATTDGGEVPRRLVRALVAPLRPRPAVYALEPRTVGDILSDVKTVGDALGRPAGARAVIVALRTRIDAVALEAARRLAAGRAPRVACLAGASADGVPVAAGWWLAELVGLAGGVDVLGGAGRPPRPVPQEQLDRARPAIVVDVGRVQPGPGAVALLERLAARLAQAPPSA